MAAKLIRHPKAEREIEKPAPDRWKEYPSYKHMCLLEDRLFDLNIDELYSRVIELRKQRPASAALTTSDNMIKVSNRGFKDQSVRTGIINLKMRVFRVSQQLENAIKVFKKTVIYEDAAWLNRNISTVKGRQDAADVLTFQPAAAVEDARTFIHYVDILVEDIDKASFTIKNGVAAIDRETVPEKFTHR